MTAEDDIDRLYGVRPEEFTALRKDLAAAARRRGDSHAAKELAAARRPTTAAWVVNVLVRSDGTARRRMAELTEALRGAHAAMDGARIRELSTTQRKLVTELVRSAFATAEITEPSAALRDDVTATLQAAIADPDVAARLGRLAKAEQWSGFGDFGVSSVVVGSAKREAASPNPSKMPSVGAAQRRREVAAAKLEAARSEQEAAAEAVTDRRGKVATARRRYEKLLETLNAAEQDVDTADTELEAAERRASDAADRVQAAAADLAEAESALAEPNE